MEAAIALAAAKKGVDRAVDLVIDTGLAAVVYVYNMWSAYGALSGDAQDIANYVDYVGGLREKVLKSNKLTDDHKHWLRTTIGTTLESVQKQSEKIQKNLENASIVEKAGTLLKAPYYVKKLKKMKKTLEELVQKLQQSDKDRPFFKELDQIPPFDVIKDDKGRTFWTDYYKEASSIKFTQLVKDYTQEAVSPKGTTAGSGAAPASQGPVDPRVYKVLGYKDRRAFLYALCGTEDDDGLPKKLSEQDAEVTCFRLHAFCEKYGWPFVPEDLPSPPQFGVHTQSERLSIASMHQKLQQEFATKELRDTMEFVRKTVDDVVKDMASHIGPNGVVNREGLYGPYQLQAIDSPNKDATKKYFEAQLRCFAADYLYRPTEAEGKRAASLARPDKPHVTREKTTRDVLDEQRRTWSFIFQRFSTMWKLGRFTEELFEGIDFPGTGRVTTFMKYCEALDEANFRLVINKNVARTKPDGEPGKKRWEDEEKGWRKSCPAVYKFLRAWLQYKDDMEAAAAAPASTTTPGTDETPGSAALDNQGQLNSQTVQGSPSDKPRVAPAGSQPDAQPVSPGPRSDPVLNPGSDPKGSFTAPVNQGTPTKQPSPPVRPLGAEAAEAAAVPGKRVAGAPTDILYGGRPRAPPGTKLIPYESPPTSTGLDQVLANPPGDPLTKWLIALVPVVLAVEGYRLVSWL